MKSTQTVHSNHQVVVQWSDHYNLDDGLKPLDTATLLLDCVLHQFETNELDESNVAQCIIHSLFERDFMGTGKHWCSDGICCKKIDNDDNSEKTFQCSESSTWDWKDIYSVATSKATIVFSNDRLNIRVEDYSFYCAG